jgi:hypothetical protein
MRCRVQRFRIVGPAAITTLARVTWTAAFLAAAPAMAAEMAVKAPWQPPVVQLYDWTGLYVGGHLGYAGGRSNWSAGPDLSSSLDLFQSSDIFTGAGSYFGGLQIGYDYMLPNRIVLGAQLDVSFPGFPRNNISIGGMSIFSTPDIGLASYSENGLPGDPIALFGPKQPARQRARPRIPQTASFLGKVLAMCCRMKTLATRNPQIAAISCLRPFSTLERARARS